MSWLRSACSKWLLFSGCCFWRAGYSRKRIEGVGMPVDDVGESTRKRTEPLLRLERVSKSFGIRKVVEALDLEVYPGEVLCVLGASGCGKTTLLRMIAGLETPDQGTI